MSEGLAMPFFKTKEDLPILIIHGDKDRSIPVEISGQKTVMLLPKNRFILYKDAPHGLYITHSDRLNHDLLTFIKGQK